MEKKSVHQTQECQKSSADRKGDWMEQPNNEKTANGADLNGGKISVPFVHEQLLGVEVPTPPRRPEIKVLSFLNPAHWKVLKFIYSEKATKFCEPYF